MNASTSAGPSNTRPSRSNSISSSVVTTIKKSASVSSRTGSRPTYVRTRSTSPDSISRVLHSLNSSRSDFRGRAEPLEGKKANGGLGVNRWSHSTSSSLSAIDADLIRKRTSSIRRSTGGAPNTVASGPQARTSLDHKLEARGSPKRSASTSNRASPLPGSRAGSRLAFQDSSNFRIVQDLSQPSNTTNSATIPGSTWEQGSGVNKFGDPISSLSIHYTTTSTPGVTASSSLSHDKGNRIDPKPRSARSRTSKDHSKTRYRELSNNATGSVGTPQSRKEQSSNSETKSPKRRDMLSRALAKANEAVVLDNEQNVNAAIEAYNEACELLQQVMVRSADLADRKKLSSIKATYSKRIAELHDFDNTFVDLMRPLPEDPPVEEYENPEDFYQEEPSYPSTAINDVPAIQLPLRQESLLPEIFGGDSFIHDNALPPVRNPLPSSRLNLPMDEQYMPPPLSPRPLFAGEPENDEYSATPTQAEAERQPPQAQQHSTSPGPSSWLDQSDGQSSKASSRLSSIDYDRKDGELMSAIEADLMNAAVDSAYDDDIDQEATPRNQIKPMDFAEVNRYDPLTGTYLDDDEEDEEQLLEDLSGEGNFDESPSAQDTLSTLPRQSDSSTYSGRTWGSSMASTTATSRTTLSTLAETIEPPLHGPPKAALPEPPRAPPEIPESEVNVLASRPLSSDKHVGIRDRRMSGQSAKQLKIETFSRRSSVAQQAKAPQTVVAAPPVNESTDTPLEVRARTLAPAASFSSSFSSAQPLTPMLSVHSGDMTMDESPATPALTQGGSTDDGTFTDPSPSRHGKMMPPPPGPLPRKNVAASNLGKGSLSINTVHLEADSPMTPGSAMFSLDARKPHSAANSAVSNPGSTVLTSMGLGGMYLFDDHIGDPRSPRSSGAFTNEPAPLEPCPDSFLLRPFWLMRCLYQALAHPRGGYVSTKLFIPRDIWRVRNVKIKALDDKIAQCDLLTAALQKLAKVDTLDAGAVLEELQTFEVILEQVRMTLSKKLGSDVGVSGSSSVFKGSPAVEDSNDILTPKSGNASSAAKSIASGWRKLRSKSSSANLAATTRNDLTAQTLTMSSLPMTSSSSVATSRSYSNGRVRYTPPTPSGMPHLAAPHAYYLAALARLFDAVQILDSIARQVEDPGLKYSSQTHVGLELSVRNAAEFFGFYIIRFVMSDILTLLDKFLKRGAEWVAT